MNFLPSSLKTSCSEETASCPQCLIPLRKEIRKEVIDCRECRACNLGVLSSSCSCTYTTVDKPYLICYNCLENERITLSQQMEQKRLQEFREMRQREVAAQEIRDLNRRREIQLKWKGSSPQEKLNFYYDIKKLKWLCKKKGIKGYSTKTRNNLIELLKDLVTDEDFPIKCD